ncbi:LysR family transcriptional regulator [Clostridium sp. MCC353]|uniref:LysR family transcriptional regulator n=1 Tax=Clostridium sp. MCC353 TaxID=2592646 RepID=UPI001C01533E|nr:LysR family transcriptional regulator [Clostridium sp. MCC353]
MTIEEIDAFLAVVECGTLSIAADKLFISQSTISQRLKRLENELGARLFLRQQGQRSAVLTPAGSNLVPMAQQWASLWRDMYSLNTISGKSSLSIGSVDLVNSISFVPLYKNVLKSHPEIELDINTHHSSEIHGLLENRIIDIGFVFSPVKYPDIISTPLYSEKMYLITRDTGIYYDNISTAKLDPQKEAYLRWNTDYELWHHSNWSQTRHLVNVNTGTNMIHYLDEPGSWTIGPASLVRFLKNRQDTAFYQLKEAPPPLVCYRLTHRYPKPSRQDVMNTFCREMELFIKSNDRMNWLGSVPPLGEHDG